MPIIKVKKVLKHIASIIFILQIRALTVKSLYCDLLGILIKKGRNFISI